MEGKGEHEIRRGEGRGKERGSEGCRNAEDEENMHFYSLSNCSYMHTLSVNLATKLKKMTNYP